MTTTQKHWFRRGQGGYGYIPQTWQGWISVVGFLAILTATVVLTQNAMGESTNAQSTAFVIAAVEIMGFMMFVRRNADKK